MAADALGYWVDAPGTGSLRGVALREAGADDVVLTSAFSGISTGTERLVGRGLVPAVCAAAMACPGMQGSFALPICYGYSLVGTVAPGRRAGVDLAGRRAFTMHPHQDRAVVPVDALVLLPDAVPSPRATLLPNLETALNAVWDAGLHAGERVVVLGCGAVGLLVAFVLAHTHTGDVVLVEPDAQRRRFATTLPWIGANVPVVLPDAVVRGSHDVAFHTTATSDGLQLAIDATGFEGRIVDLSWYGTKPVTLDLGSTFHHQRKRITASQVGTIAPSHREQGRAARTDAVLQLLADAQLDALLAPPVPFAQLPEFFARLYRGDLLAPCPVVAYATV